MFFLKIKNITILF